VVLPEEITEEAQQEEITEESETVEDQVTEPETAEEDEAETVSEQEEVQEEIETVAEPETEETSEESAESEESSEAEAEEPEEESSEESSEEESSEDEESEEKLVTVNQSYFTGNVTVFVNSNGVEAIPEGAELVVREIAEGTAEYIEAVALLAQNGVDYDGMFIVDVSFMKDGKEVEPSAPIAVSMVISSEKLSENVNPESVKISHIDESEGYSKLEQVADTGNETAGYVDVADDAVSASFKLNSFSLLVGTYSVDDTASFGLEQYNQTFELEIGETATADSFSYKKNTKVNVSSSNTNVATATTTGDRNNCKVVITAVNNGEAVITLSFTNTSNISETRKYKVTVKEKDWSKYTITISGDTNVAQFGTTKLTATLTPSVNNAKITWHSEDTNYATVGSDGTVTGKKQGEVKITASVNEQLSSSVTVTIGEPSSSSSNYKGATFVYLKSPTSDPASNSTSQWVNPGASGSVYLEGATWTDASLVVKNFFDDGTLKDRVVWPSGYENGVVPEGTHWNTIYNAFKDTVEGGVSKEDVDEILLHPYKVSSNWGAIHVDCTVEIRVKSIYTASYYLWDAGEAGYVWKYAENVREGKTTQPNTILATLPKTKTAGGRTYRLVSWYDNKDLSGTTVSFPYTMTDETGNKQFYAKYVADYLVKYNVNGGDQTSAPGTDYKSAGSTVTVSSKIPVREGYRFIGWQSDYDSDGDGKNNSFVGGNKFTMPAKDISLTAQWERTEGYIRIEKVVTGLPEDVSSDVEYEFSISGPDDNETTSVTITGEGSTTIKVPTGEYTVTEITEGKTYDVGAYLFNEDSSETETSPVAVSDKSTETDPVVFTITNNYVPGTGTLKITKAIADAEGNALELDDVKIYYFTVSGDGYEEVHTVTGAGSIEIEVPAGEYTVTENAPEDNAYDTAKYHYVSNSGSEEAAVTAGETSEVTVTNSYELKTGDLKITKVIDGVEDAAQYENTEFTFTVTKPDNTTEEVTITGAGSTTIENLPIGDYTVEETGDTDDLDDYYFVSKSDAVVAEVTFGGEAEATITNTYAKFLKVTVTKTVTGNMADMNRQFAFTYSVNGGESTGFSLGNNGEQVIGKLKSGDKVTVTETEANTDGYITTAVIGDSEYSNGSELEITADTTIEYTNKKEVVTPTGVHLDSMPYILMAIGITLMGAFGIMMKLRKRREDD
ncbi:MAG: DUF5979 domain-containing protein, partial [Clostridia bacterium]|nr:DUF5979 domain-containing protein [Clostridia bacterium]